MVGAYENSYDRLVLASSDTDLLPAIQAARKKGNPSHALIEHATETRLLRKDDLTPFVVEKAKKK